MLSREDLQTRMDELLHGDLSELETELVGMVEAAKKRGPLGSGADPFQEDSED
jgi:hypothetical protein